MKKSLPLLILLSLLVRTCYTLLRMKAVPPLSLLVLVSAMTIVSCGEDAAAPEEQGSSTPPAGEIVVIGMDNRDAWDIVEGSSSGPYDFYRDGTLRCEVDITPHSKFRSWCTSRHRWVTATSKDRIDFSQFKSARPHTIPLPDIPPREPPWDGGKRT